MSKGNTGKAHKIFTIIGIVLCIILIPVLLINLTLIAKSYINKEKVPDIGGYMPLIVLTDSMYPEIAAGDLIVCKTLDAEDVKVGDVISFFDPAGNGTSIVTHRVIEIINEDGKILFRTKGDFNNTEDKDPVPEDKLVSMYLFKIPGAGDVAMFMQSTTGLILCVLLPIVLIVTYDMIRRRLYEKDRKDDKAELLAELEALRAEKAALENRGETPVEEKPEA